MQWKLNAKTASASSAEPQSRSTAKEKAKNESQISAHPLATRVGMPISSSQCYVRKLFIFGKVLGG
jgi:hypothetical protein